MTTTFDDLLSLFDRDADRRRFVEVARAYHAAPTSAERDARYLEARALIEGATANARYAVPGEAAFAEAVDTYLEREGGEGRG